MKYRHYAPHARVEIVELPSNADSNAPADGLLTSADGLLTGPGRDLGRDAFLETVLGALRRGETVRFLDCVSNAPHECILVLNLEARSSQCAPGRAKWHCTTSQDVLLK